MTENERLRHACESYLQASLRVLASQPVPYMSRLNITFQDQSGNSISGESVLAPDYWRLVTTHEARLQDVAETDAVLQIVREDAVLSSLLLSTGSSTRVPPEEERRQFQSRYLTTFVIEYLSRSIFAIYDPDTFSSVYEQFEQFIYHYDSIVVHWLVQFRNLTTTIEVVELEPGVRLRRAAEDERRRAAEASLVDMVGISTSFSETMRLTSSRLSRPPDVDEIPSVFLDIEDRRERSSINLSKAYIPSQRLLSALRLLDSSPIDGHSIWHVNPNPFVPNPLPRQPYDALRPPTFSGERYVITAELAAHLQELWPKTAQLPRDPRLSLALRRFDDSYHRDRSDDRLIDYWIALEALFLSDNQQELSFRAALRIACFVEQVGAERLAAFQAVKGSYALRSKVVHGVEIEPKHNLSNVVVQTGETLRRVLRSCVDRGQAPTPEEIDIKLLVGECS